MMFHFSHPDEPQQVGAEEPCGGGEGDGRSDTNNGINAGVTQ